MLNWIKLRRLELYAKQFGEINAISVGQKVIRSGRLREINFAVVSQVPTIFSTMHHY
jgi:hypothetical protein